jgi:hypothetical protein
MNDNNLWVNLQDLKYLRDNWLRNFADDRESGSLSLYSQSVVKSIWEYIEARQYDRVWPLCAQLRRQVIEHGSYDEMGAVLVELARVEDHFGRVEEAKQLLEKAANRLIKDEFSYAVVRWMLGGEIWNVGEGKQSEALLHWEYSRNSFIALRSDNRVGDSRNKWYSERLQEIDRFLKIAQENLELEIDESATTQEASGEQPEVETQPRTSSQPVPEFTDEVSSNSDLPPKTPSRTQSEGVLQSYPVLPGAVHAGEFKKMVGRGLEDFDRIYIREIEINDEIYEIHSLRQSRVVPMTGGKSTYAIEVLGDSMDAYPILPGDYVLVSTTLEPQSGDIVVTQVVEQQDDVPLANVKFLKARSKDEIILEYRSNNPNYFGKQIILNKKMNEWSAIFGVAIARFAKKDS